MEQMEQIYIEYSPAIYQYLYKICKDSMLAEEVTQETFFRIISRCSTRTQFDLSRFFRKHEPVELQICRLADQMLEKELARKRRELPVEPMEVVSADIPATDYLPEAYAIHQIELNEIKEKIQKLKEPMYNVISLRYYRHMTYREVAAYLHQSENWVKHMLRQGRMHLEHML